MKRLTAVLEKQIAASREQVKRLKKCENPVDTLKVKHVLTGLRGVKVINWTCTQQDPMKGYVVRGVPLDDLVLRLPRVSTTPVPEAMLWYLLTGVVPKPPDLLDFQQELQSRSIVPGTTICQVPNIPQSLPLLTKLSILLLTMQPHSHFVRSYAERVPRGEMWRSALEDSLTIFARLPTLLALALNQRTPPSYVNYADSAAEVVLGKRDARLADLLRLIFVVLADGDGGSVSAHACKTVSSTLSDPYLSLSSAFSAVSGPRHARASQDCLLWLQSLHSKLGYKPSEVAIAGALDEEFRKRHLLPGFGHAVLQVNDPRYTLLLNYVKDIAPSDEIIQLAEKCARVAREALTGVRNPTPNVDFALAVALQALGVKDPGLLPALFALGRSMGLLSNLVWDRALQIPIEYAVSVDMRDLEKLQSTQVGSG